MPGRLRGVPVIRRFLTGEYVGYRGNDRGKNFNDVWRSGDGNSWALVTASAAFSARYFHQAASYGGSLWVIGGNDGGKLNDVWRSADGERWFLATTPPFAKREKHQVVVVYPDPFADRVASISVTAPKKVVTVRVPASLTPPVSVATLTVTGGDGEVWFELLTDTRGLLSVAADGALVATALADGVVTASIRVGDATRLNRATVAVTVDFVFSLTLAKHSARFVVSPGYSGFLAFVGGGGPGRGIMLSNRWGLR